MNSQPTQVFIKVTQIYNAQFHGLLEHMRNKQIQINLV